MEKRTFYLWLLSAALCANLGRWELWVPRSSSYSKESCRRSVSQIWGRLGSLANISTKILNLGFAAGSSASTSGHLAVFESFALTRELASTCNSFLRQKCVTVKSVCVCISRGLITCRSIDFVGFTDGPKSTDRASSSASGQIWQHSIAFPPTRHTGPSLFLRLDVIPCPAIQPRLTLTINNETILASH